jgi:uncharacterized protein YbbC (DUF1343 family)/CubicO group peptidase (beta-lactamase class C family)
MTSVSRGIRLLAAFVVLLVALPAAASTDSFDFAAVDTAARDAVATGEIPGAVILVGRGDTVLYHRAFGWRALVPDAEPMTPDTIFDIASLTKPLGTTLAIMALVERGALKLDAPLGRYLKEFRGAEFKNVTIARMLTHSAGFPGYPPNAAVQGGFPSAARAIAKVKLDYPPGAGFQYSDTGFILLGEVVRRVAGESLDRYVDRLLVRPLGLRETTFHPGAAMRARTAPTEFWQGRMLRAEVHDPRARLLGGVAGHAGMFSTTSDVARICRLLLDGGAVSGKQVLRPETIALMWSRSTDGNGRRTLGWDMSSGYSLIHAPFFPAGSVGHTGFTGTSVWLDPASRSYMVLLTNRVHPNGGSAARIRELRVRVAAAVGAALFAPLAPPAPTPEAASDTPAPATEAGASRAGGRVRSGLDVLAEQDFGLLKGHAVGLVTNQTGIDAGGRRAIDLIAAAPGVKLQAIFSPEHGITGTAETDVAHGRDAATGRPIWSLYGQARRPYGSMMDGVSAFVFDIQDVGVRYYTYLTTLVYVMEEAARRNLPVFVLDRPNPITGRVVEGPLMDPDLDSFTAPHTIPVRTGMTIGEFARMAAAEKKIPVALTVVPLAGWDRTRWFDQTGLPWVNPSPNIRSVTQALLYSGIGLLEATNLSVGRGTDTPFEIVGAPWIEPNALVAALQRRNLRGVRFEPVWFTPTADKYARVACGGVRFIVTDREAIRPVTVGLAVAVALREHHRDQWRAETVQNLLVNRTTMWAFLRGEPLDRLLAWSDADRNTFLNRRASYLIY